MRKFPLVLAFAFAACAVALGPATLEAMKFYEVQKYVTYLPVVSNGGIFLMSAKAFQRLGPEQQQAVTASARAWVKSMDDEGLKQDTEALRKMEAKGTKVNTIKDMTPYVNATVATVSRFFPARYGPVSRAALSSL